MSIRIEDTEGGCWGEAHWMIQQATTPRHLLKIGKLSLDAEEFVLLLAGLPLNRRTTVSVTHHPAPDERWTPHHLDVLGWDPIPGVPLAQGESWYPTFGVPLAVGGHFMVPQENLLPFLRWIWAQVASAMNGPHPLPKWTRKHDEALYILMVWANGSRPLNKALHPA